MTASDIEVELMTLCAQMNLLCKKELKKVCSSSRIYTLDILNTMKDLGRYFSYKNLTLNKKSFQKM